MQVVRGVQSVACGQMGAVSYNGPGTTEGRQAGSASRQATKRGCGTVAPCRGKMVAHRANAPVLKLLLDFDVCLDALLGGSQALALPPAHGRHEAVAGALFLHALEALLGRWRPLHRGGGHGGACAARAGAARGRAQAGQGETRGVAAGTNRARWQCTYACLRSPGKPQLPAAPCPRMQDSYSVPVASTSWQAAQACNEEKADERGLLQGALPPCCPG